MTELREWSGNERKGKINKLKTQRGDEWQRERERETWFLGPWRQRLKMLLFLTLSPTPPFLCLWFPYFLFSFHISNTHPSTVSALILLNIIPFLSLSIAPQSAAVGDTGEGSVAPLMQRITGREGREEKRLPCWPCPAAKHWMAMVMLVQRGVGYEQEGYGVRNKWERLKVWEEAGIVSLMSP